MKWYSILSRCKVSMKNVPFTSEVSVQMGRKMAWNSKFLSKRRIILLYPCCNQSHVEFFASRIVNANISIRSSGWNKCFFFGIGWKLWFILNLSDSCTFYKRQIINILMSIKFSKVSPYSIRLKLLPIFFLSFYFNFLLHCLFHVSC